MIIVDGKVFKLDLEEAEVIELAKEITIMPCYVPGNFPWRP